MRGLQAQGITGKGVRAAIIDQPLLTDHPELSGRIAAYYDTGCEGETSLDARPGRGQPVCGRIHRHCAGCDPLLCSLALLADGQPLCRRGAGLGGCAERSTARWREDPGRFGFRRTGQRRDVPKRRPLGCRRGACRAGRASGPDRGWRRRGKDPPCTLPCRPCPE